MAFKWLSLLLICASAPLLAAEPALDSTKPIDITADKLEVRQQEKLAVFSGSVVAKQGNITMKSARMLVYYDGAGQSGASATAAGATSISKIEADGGVFFATPKETAKSSKAIYNVPKEQIRMIGDVTLTRESSVVKGAGLVYNLKTGRSILTSAAGTGSAGQAGGRVRGLFVPKKEGGE